MRIENTELEFGHDMSEREIAFAIAKVETEAHLREFERITARYNAFKDTVSFWLPRGKIPFAWFKVG